MASQTSDPQINGVPSSSAGASTSQTVPNTQVTAAASATGSQPPSQSQPTQSSSTQQASQQAQLQNSQQQNSSQQQSTPLNPNASAPRPRDARMIELLLTSQGVTSYESRVPLLLLDFAYRHTSSILSDAIYLSADPYTSQAGSKASASGSGAGAIPGAGGDAAVSANAVKLAIAARLGYQFRGGGGAGGVSKDWLQELARERNKTALPKVAQNEWGLRLPSERFVLSGVSWGLKDVWEEAGIDEDEDEDSEDGAAAAGGDSAMEGVEATNATADEDIGGDGVEGGTMEDVFGKDVDEDAEMEGTS
ncbi:transcription initiation factor IID, 31kD subunit-domain-containing protein [Colletotrichum navitas]|uniref:Transcription initiation factor IID, 31kD subunit-domain-containing protein n=1 Tax=Colletotrichum navitas TaxID=681940 RepID=A0AAD8Q5V5_9PEZI|nr:transcription initiation factor IID, 31kD subunit-domain-containing protein [Colletotrichum navitas]KAK1595811.1 transcription initiation factor IID, 31kD subunit-domain-containing protein [Colletotrichum navitas]